MAYNVLKGKVDGAVDQHADQEIDGVKVFKSTISASVFYDTDAQSPCATMKDVAIRSVENASRECILTWGGAGIARANRNLKFEGDTLKTYNVQAKTFKGSGAGLTNLPVDKFDGKISAKYINHGAGLRNVRATLQVTAGSGIEVTDSGVAVALQPQGGIALKSDKLIIKPSLALPINTKGQNLSDDDVVLIEDVSAGAIRSTTLRNFYDNYVNVKVPHAAGSKEEIQFKGSVGFSSSPLLSFDTKASSLNVVGGISALNVDAKASLRCTGAVYKAIKTIQEKEYTIQPDDHTLVCDTSSGCMRVSLPAPANNKGRILVIKKVDKNKHKITSHPLVVFCEDGRVDIGNEMKLKMTYASRTLQCDGENWWVIGSKGS